MIQYNILKIFITHFGKINQTYFILCYNFINEWERLTLKNSEIQCCPKPIIFSE